MRVVILGSGVVGVASAWYLNQAGHEVTVIDREPGAALETSAANAGQISPGYAAPWAAPGVPLKAIKWMFQRHAPLAVRLDGTQFQLKWMWQMLRNCDTSHYMENKGRMVRLAEYSRDCLKALRAETNIQYEGRQGGTLQLFRTEQQYENATRDIAVLEDAGVPYQLLESSRLAEVDPALAEVAHKLTGGLQLPNDETGDCQLFTQNLARMAEQAAEGLECRRSLSNSAATLWHPEAHFDWVRPGIILYGASPSGQWRDIANTGLRPVMTLSSEIIGVQTLKAGERVGYGGRYTARDEQRIGIVAAGYADGYPRHAPTGAPVLVDGVRTMTVGTVSMDMLAVDLTPCPQAGIGTPVELWGKEIKIDDVAAAAGTVGYELMCALALRVPVVTV